MLTGDAALEEQSFALNQLDLKLKPYLNFTSGFFIEAGANNGINQSNTLYFEKYRKWKGLLIEPIPELAKQCKVNRPNCIVESCALVPFGFEKPEIEMYYCNLMSLVKGAQKSQEADLQHLQRGEEVQQIKSYELTVPARTLTSILDQYSVSQIDLLSLDVEGFELDVLKGLDFEKYQPTFLLIEARYRTEIDSFLSEKYEVIAELSHHDVLYKSKQKLKEEREFKLTAPVAFFIFNRPDLTQQVFQSIAQAKPEKLFVVADGPRTEEEEEICCQTREIIKQINWDCQLFTNFSDRNLGCKERVASGLRWVFSEVEEAIILEDDCLPTSSFFRFCQTLLDYYRYDTRIYAISGDNFQQGQRRTDHSYYFSRYFHCWGWASWRRVWQQFESQMQGLNKEEILERTSLAFENPHEQEYWIDQFTQTYDGKINSWAYLWFYTCLSHSGLTILPEDNLVSNIGSRQDGTHTKDTNSPLANLPTNDIWQIQHPPTIVRHRTADDFTFKFAFGGKQVEDMIGQLQENFAQAQTQQQQMQIEMAQQQLQRQQLEAQFKQTQSELAQAQTEYQHLQKQVLDQQQLQVRTEQQQQQLQDQLTRAQARTQQLQSKLAEVRERSQKRQQNLKSQLAEAQNTLKVMESSKFWKLRTLWLKLKFTLRSRQS